MDRGTNATAWEGRRHFFAATAEAMRRILVEAARRKKRLKHDGQFSITALLTRRQRLTRA